MESELPPLDWIQLDKSVNESLGFTQGLIRDLCRNLLNESLKGLPQDLIMDFLWDSLGGLLRHSARDLLESFKIHFWIYARGFTKLAS